MNIKIKLFLFYLLIFSFISIIYYEVDHEFKKQHYITKEEIFGVKYLKKVYELNVNLIKATGMEDFVDPADIVDEILVLQAEKNLGSKKFVQYLQKIKSNSLTYVEYIEFLEFLNHENYSISDQSKLMFDPDRRISFLAKLVDHYMPEYITSGFLSHSLIEEFYEKKFLTDDKKNLYIEQNKLLELSYSEVREIVYLLDRTASLEGVFTSLEKIQTKLDGIRLINKEILLFKTDSDIYEKYFDLSHDLLDLSIELNDELFLLTDKFLQKRLDELKTIIQINNIIFIFLFVLITASLIYFYRIKKESFLKDVEIKKINEMLDEVALYSKTDKNGYITHVSSAFERFTGYSKDELIGKTHRILRHEDVDKKLYEDLWSTILDKKVWKNKILNKAKDGSSTWVNITIVPEFDKHGDIDGFVSYREDITNQVDLEEAYKFKSKFLSNMSHEIRTPINSVIGFTDVILKTKLDEKQQEYMNYIQTASKHLLSVINDILDISKIESGKMIIEDIDFNLFETVDAIVKILNNEALKKGLSLECKYEGITNSTYMGDPFRISQILTNLLGNAIKFTSEGSVLLSVSKDDSYIKFVIKDSGIGLKKDEIKNLFDDFTQANMNTSRKHGGTGLGLSISKNLVELMNGEMYVESEYGLGSTFSFILPLKPSKKNLQSIEDTNQKDQDKIKEIVSSLEGRKILVAEDNKMNQLVVEMLLEDTKLEIDFANDGEIAVDKFKNNDYDLVLMDIQMPNMDGYEATEAIRKENKNIAIVALSANVLEDDIKKAKDSGVNDYLPKPIDIDTLYELLYKYFVLEK